MKIEDDGDDEDEQDEDKEASERKRKGFEEISACKRRTETTFFRLRKAFVIAIHCTQLVSD